MSDTPTGKTFALFASPANRKIIRELEAAGNHLMLFPHVETKPVELKTSIEKVLTNLAEFDWLVFPDVFSAEYFLQALERLGIDFFELDAARVAAFGETVSDRLRFSQIHADVISNSVEPRKVIQAIENYDAEIEKRRFLVPKGGVETLEITKLLSEKGASAVEIPLYEAAIEPDASLTKLKTLFKGGAADEFIFCSPVEIFNLAIIFYPEKPAELLKEIQVAAADFATLQSLREFGLSKIKMR